MINLIKFNKEYYELIINGLKTQTLRKSNKRLKENEIVKATFPGIKEECYLRITKTGYKQFKHINDEDAKMEGYSTSNELKKELLKIYPRLDNLTRLYYYQFKVVDEIAWKSTLVRSHMLGQLPLRKQRRREKNNPRSNQWTPWRNKLC